MKRLKIITVLGTRPEIIRLSMLIPKLDKFTDHVLVHTGQNYDPKLSDIFFEDLKLREPDYQLGIDTSSLGTAMGEVLQKSEAVFRKERPDAVMILGDTNSSVAAIVAERMGIPVYHMEAGNRSFDKNVPEELNRKMVDHIATFNLPYTEHARRNLLSEGLHPRFIYLSGSPIKEILQIHQSEIESKQVLSRLGINRGEFFLISVHRQENVDSPSRLSKILDCLAAIEKKWGLPIVVSTHPRTRERLSQMGVSYLEGVTFHEPFGYLDYMKLQQEAKCVISDSGTLSEESAICGFRAVSIRDSTERPESIENGALILSGLEPDHLVSSIELADSSSSAEVVPAGYETCDFSERVIKILMSTVTVHRSWGD